jgi:hypothetical protein
VRRVELLPGHAPVEEAVSVPDRLGQVLQAAVELGGREVAGDDLCFYFFIWNFWAGFPVFFFL